MPNQIKYNPPAYLIKTKKLPNKADKDDKPNTVKSIKIKSPSMTHVAVATEALNPWLSDFPTTISTAGPGMAAATNIPIYNVTNDERDI